MPKSTFFNLPEEKRAAICRVGIAEFARYSYDSASINRIIASAGIAKGSFYQYFEDKRDLFLYLWELVSLEKASYIAPVMQNPEQHDIFTLLKELYISGIRFAEERPEYAEMGNRLLRDKSTAIYQEVISNSMPIAYVFFETLLNRAIARDEVKAGIDVKMFAFMIASMNALVVEYYAANAAQAFDEEMMAGIDEFIEFLKNGIGTNEKAAGYAGVTPAIGSTKGEKL